MPVLNVEELERQAIDTFTAATAESAASGPAGSPGMPGTARRKKKKSGKGGAGKKGKKKGGAIESELNVYGIEWGLGVAAGSALIDFLIFRFGFLGSMISSLFGGNLTLFLFVFTKVIMLGTVLYFAVWMIDEQRYPLGNMLIITGLQSWVPQLGWMALAWANGSWGVGLHSVPLLWFAWIWMVSATFAIFKGLLETDNEGTIFMLVVVLTVMNWYLQDNAFEVASQVASVLQTIGQALGLI